MKIIDDIRGKKVLVAPMDWGLGHAARCIPVIERLLVHDNKILIVCGPSAHDFLKKELPGEEIIVIDDKKIRYPKGRINLFTILGWVPTLVRNTVHEHGFVKKIIKERGIDCVISDNRYGLKFSNIECYCITHQVYPKMPRGLSFLEGIVGAFFVLYLHRYDKVLIPDFEEGPCLSGMLAGYRSLPDYQFAKIGILSRFRPDSDIAAVFDAFSSFFDDFPDLPRHTDIMVLISGQEDQRTVFEDMLIATLDGCGRSVLFVRGVGQDREPLKDTDNITFINMLCGSKLRYAISHASAVICRAGYSTLCDIVAIKRRTIIIPTPGQTEQEYLAEWLDGQLWFMSVRQTDKDFSKKVLNLVEYFMSLSERDRRGGD